MICIGAASVGVATFHQNQPVGKQARCGGRYPDEPRSASAFMRVSTRYARRNPGQASRVIWAVPDFAPLRGAHPGY
jgi:hypothetical protein